MPSQSPAQARLMAAAAHTQGGYDGVPQQVGAEFNRADAGGPMLAARRPVQKKPQGLARQAALVMALRGRGGVGG